MTRSRNGKSRRELGRIMKIGSLHSGNANLSSTKARRILPNTCSLLSMRTSRNSNFSQLVLHSCLFWEIFVTHSLILLLAASSVSQDAPRTLAERTDYQETSSHADVLGFSTDL